MAPGKIREEEEEESGLGKGEDSENVQLRFVNQRFGSSESAGQLSRKT